MYILGRKKNNHTHISCVEFEGVIAISTPPSPLISRLSPMKFVPLVNYPFKLCTRDVCVIVFFLPKIYTNVYMFYVVARKRTIRLFLYLSMNNLKTRAFIWNLGEINILVRSGVTVLVRIIVRLPPTWHITFSFCFHNLQKIAQNWCS